MLSYLICPVVAVEPNGNALVPFVPQIPLYEVAGGAATGASTVRSRSHIGRITKTYLGPIMGITSVLWLIMRNDPAVKPELSWM